VHKALEGLDSEDLFVSVISIGEITRGIRLLSESENRRALGEWLATLERGYADRLLPIDLETWRILVDGHCCRPKNGVAPCLRRTALSPPLRYGVVSAS